MSDFDPSQDTAVVKLDPETAWVLSSLLDRWLLGERANSPADSCFESRGECAALSEVLAQLEKQLVAPFTPQYDDLLDRARQRLSENWPYGYLRDHGDTSH